jgi:hypothetical protein
MVLATASILLAQNVASKLTNLPLIADGTTALTNPGFSAIVRDDLRVKPSKDAEMGKESCSAEACSFRKLLPAQSVRHRRFLDSLDSRTSISDLRGQLGFGQPSAESHHNRR